MYTVQNLNLDSIN